MKSFIVENSQRVDTMLSKHFPSYSRSYFQHLIQHGGVICNGKRVKNHTIPKVGDEITLFFTHVPTIQLKPQNIPLKVLFEDQYLISINKPPGIVVHPAPGHVENTCVNALLHHCRLPILKDVRPGIVHRLDRYTSGVLIVAKTLEVYHKLIAAFSMRKIHKEYLAITVGNPGNQVVDLPIGRHPTKRKKMSITSSGKEAITRIMTLKSKNNFSLVRVVPITGRMHQIRTHLKYLNTPILGDVVYGPRKLNHKLKVGRQLLHAQQITFMHPVLEKRMRIFAPILEDFQEWSNKLGLNSVSVKEDID